jgi:hypothetical protein
MLCVRILCLQSRDFSSKWRAIKQLVDDFSSIRMVVARKTEGLNQCIKVTLEIFIYKILQSSAMPWYFQLKDEFCSGFSFIDIDECKGGHSCDVGKSVCENLDGSYRCNCFPGYIMSGNGKSCIRKFYICTLSLVERNRVFWLRQVFTCVNLTAPV